MTSKAERAADRRIERAYYKSCSGIQVNVFDLSKIYSKGRELIAAGADDEALERGVLEFVQTIRRN